MPAQSSLNLSRPKGQVDRDSCRIGSRDSLQRSKEGRDSMEHLNVEKLREEFNRASASVRVVSVFSPT